jgi:tetratricopeptide (TPR) repeat protein
MWRRLLVPIVVLVGSTLSPISAYAVEAPTEANAAAPPPLPEAVEAQEHFARAKALYLRGEYRQSIVELQTARRLDPHAVELVYNLAVVHEKLGEIDAAIASWREYEALATTDEERQKAQTSVNRLDAFKKKRPTAPPPLLSPTAAPKRGRLDGATVAAASVGIAGLALGSVFGVLALSSQPEGQARTTASRSYDSLQAQADTTASRALIADIGFAVGATSCVASALLYLLRFDTPKVASGRIGLVPGPGGLAIGGTWK